MINIIKYFSLGILFIICISCNAEETVPQTVININTNTNSENTKNNESHSNFLVELNQNSSAEYQVTETFADVPGARVPAAEKVGGGFHRVPGGPGGPGDGWGRAFSGSRARGNVGAPARLHFPRVRNPRK